MAIQQTTSISLHKRILCDIEHRIVSGTWPPGHRIPSEHELTTEFNCSRMTVNKVLTQLAAAGLVERRRKAGSFVTSPRSRSAILEIKDIKAEVSALGLPYRFEIVRREKRRSKRADRERLELTTAGGAVLDLDCLHFAGERPFCLENRIINLLLVPEAALQTFDEVAPGAWLLSRAPWTSAEHTIRSRNADADTAAILKVGLGAACLIIDRRTWLGEQPVTQVRLTYPGDAHELLAHFSPSHSKV